MQPIYDYGVFVACHLFIASAIFICSSRDRHALIRTLQFTAVGFAGGLLLLFIRHQMLEITPSLQDGLVALGWIMFWISLGGYMAVLVSNRKFYPITEEEGNNNNEA